MTQPSINTGQPKKKSKKPWMLVAAAVFGAWLIAQNESESTQDFTKMGADALEHFENKTVSGSLQTRTNCCTRR